MVSEHPRSNSDLLIRLDREGVLHFSGIRASRIWFGPANWVGPRKGVTRRTGQKMAKLWDHANRLQQDNDRLRTLLEADWGENARGHTHPAPRVQPSKGKEPILPGDSDPPADDELSSGSSPLPHLSPPQNNVEVESRKRPPSRSSRSVSGMRHRTRR